MMELTSHHRKYYGASFSPQKPVADRCAKQIWDGGISYQCANKRGYGQEGAFCKMHDPERVKAKADTRYAAWEAKSKAREHAHRFANNGRNFYMALARIAAGEFFDPIADPVTIAAQAIKGIDPPEKK